MVKIDYAEPGTQAYVDSIVDELAPWGVEYVNLDGITNGNVPDIMAWSAAIEQSGRPIVLDTTRGSLTRKIAPDLEQYPNQWEFAPEIEINGPGAGSASSCHNPRFTGCSSVFPLTSYSHWRDRFHDVATCQPYGGPGGFNDYDSIEVGNGPADDGITDAEAQSQLSLWAMAASPLILGADLTNLDSAELGYLKNTAVIALDQDGIDAGRIVSHGNQQVFAKTERNGDVILGLFNNSGSASQTVTVSLAAAGIRGRATATNLWTGAAAGTLSGTYRVTLGAGAVQLLKLVPV
jgi:alpha-galactosidase